jgi:hypothetical protein
VLEALGNLSSGGKEGDRKGSWIDVTRGGGGGREGGGDRKGL